MVAASPPGMRDFFVCDLFDVSPKADLGSMEHPMFSLSTKPDRMIRQYSHNGVDVTVTPSVRGRATIHDKDILIYCVSQLMAAMNAGRAISRKLTLTAHDLLIATRRDTGGDSYTRLREAFERLAGTRITTNIAVGGKETTSGFGLIESWEIIRRTKPKGKGEGRMVSVTVTLSEWLFRAVQAKSVLTLSRDYFSLRKPLERRIYELSRKHCGNQREWRIKLPLLHGKAGSDAPVRVFRAAVRRMMVDDNLPDYTLTEDPGDIIVVQRKRLIEDDAPVTFGPTLSPATTDAAREIAPGWDIHALEAEWRAFWVSSGRPKLTSADKAYLGWLKGRVQR